MLVLPIVAMLALSTTLAEAGERHVRKVIHQMSDARGRFVPAPTYFGDRDCTSAASTRDSFIVCFPGKKFP
jgi:hypothetical protein